MNLTPEELDRQIKAAQARHAPPDAADAPPPTRHVGAQAMRAGVDLVAALLVAGCLGYWVDTALGTRPWVMIVMIILGFVAGLLNIIRSQTGR